MATESRISSAPSALSSTRVELGIGWSGTVREVIVDEGDRTPRMAGRGSASWCARWLAGDPAGRSAARSPRPPPSIPAGIAIALMVWAWQVRRFKAGKRESVSGVPVAALALSSSRGGVLLLGLFGAVVLALLDYWKQRLRALSDARLRCGYARERRFGSVRDHRRTLVSPLTLEPYF